MDKKIPLSVAIITKNESANLPDCLNSVSFADQIVVVDSESTDNTVQIANDFGCIVHVEPWRGFGPQKQCAIDRCSNRWILVLDADEKIPAETASVIGEIVSADQNKAQGYSFPRRNYFKGRWIRHLGWWPDRVVRLFQKGKGAMSEALVHEAIEINGSIGQLDVPIDHYTESNLSNILLKIDRYSTLGAREAHAAGKRSSMYSAAFRALLVFFQNYFLRLGILDGSQGLTLSITDSINKFCKYAKLAELGKETKEHSR